VRRTIVSRGGKRRRSGGGETRAPRKDDVAAYAAAAVFFTPHAEITSEHFPQSMARRGVGLNRQSDGRRRARVFAALNLTSELFAQHARNQRQVARAAGYVQSVDLTLRGNTRGGLDSPGDKRPALRVIVRDGNRRGLTQALLDGIEIQHNPASVRMQRL